MAQVEYYVLIPNMEYRLNRMKIGSLLDRLSASAEILLPLGTPVRKVVEIVSVVLIIQGLAAVFLFSYVGPWLGIMSFVSGVVLVVILHPSSRVDRTESPVVGIRLVDSFVDLVGGRLVMMAIGVATISVVVLYNLTASDRPELGDIDTLVICLGLVIFLHPVMEKRFKVEAGFAIIFIGLCVLLLALPQIIGMSLSESRTDSVGNWYVHYMLAAPFSGALDLIGIPSSSSGNLVTIQFQDGTIQTLTISAYCAGLYSFTIFLSAFVAFVLMFERLPNRILAIVLLLGLTVAYLGNLVRMIAIGIIGYYHGIDALHWAHENVGWLIFLGWSSVFWWLLLGYASKMADRSGRVTEAN